MDNRQQPDRDSVTPAPRRTVKLAGAAAALLVLFAFCWPMFQVPGGIASSDRFRNNDWLNCRVFDLMSRATILDEGQLPLRSHLVGGGFPTIAHPSDGTLAVTLPAVLLLGDVLGVKVNILLFILFGCWGVYRLGRAWLGLGRPAALFAALLFGLSGWLPSMLLVGFYNQLFYFLIPPALHLVLGSPGRPSRLLWAGLLMAQVLLVGGLAFPAAGFFIALVIWLHTAAELPTGAPAWRRVGAPVALLLALLAPASAAQLAASPLPLLGWVLLPVMVWRSATLGAFVRALAPWAARGALVLAVALSLGAVRLGGLLYLHLNGANYNHQMDVGDSLMRSLFEAKRVDAGSNRGDNGGDGEADAEQDDEEEGDGLNENFYHSAADLARGLLNRAPAEGKYHRVHGIRVEPAEYEYAYLGLTLPPLLLALAGLLFPGRRRAVLALLALLFTAICLGHELPPDWHALLTLGVPGLSLLHQPIKYYNFFILLPLVLLAAAGAEGLVARLGQGARVRVGWAVAGVLLAWPFVQNRGPLGELFRHPVRAERVGEYHQIMQIDSPHWADLPDQEILRKGVSSWSRESVRPEAATEYYNALRGVGTIDWYGTLRRPEHAVPRTFVLMRGGTLPNRRYRGEAWTGSGQGRIHRVRIRPNTISVEVELAAPDTVVINQTHLPGFASSAGVILAVRPDGTPSGDGQGMLGVRLAAAGRHRLELSYRPPLILASLGVSALAALAWVVGLVWTRRRRPGGGQEASHAG